jgi:hypothetical protein
MTLTSTQKIHLLTAGLYLIDVPLMIGDKLGKMPLPGWLSTSWPAVFMGATILDKVLRIIFAPDVPPVPNSGAQGIASLGLMKNPPIQGPNNPIKP